MGGDNIFWHDPFIGLFLKRKILTPNWLLFKVNRLAWPLSPGQFFSEIYLICFDKNPNIIHIAR
jgi:hypothetical protein